jgi:hypothetical protein
VNRAPVVCVVCGLLLGRLCDRGGLCLSSVGMLLPLLLAFLEKMVGRKRVILSSYQKYKFKAVRTFRSGRFVRNKCALLLWV